jgi:hypothetical protein
LPPLKTSDEIADILNASDESYFFYAQEGTSKQVLGLLQTQIPEVLHWRAVGFPFEKLPQSRG